MTPNHKLRSDLVAAHAALGEAINRLPDALHVLNDMQPGYPSSTIGNGGGGGDTQPERLSLPGVTDQGHDGPSVLDLERAYWALIDLDRDIATVKATVDRVYDTCTRYGVTRKPNPARDETPSEQWCRSCWRDHGYCEPIAVKADGARRYTLPLCRWCGEWRAIHNNDPPIELIEARHRGERISEAMASRFLAKLAANEPVAANGSKKRKAKVRR